MNPRRAKKLPMRAGKEKRGFDFNSIDIVDLAAQPESAPEPAESGVLEAEEIFDPNAEIFSPPRSLTGKKDARTPRKFPSPKREYRIFNSATQEKIGFQNEGRIRHIHLGVRLAGAALALTFVVLVGIYISRTDRNLADRAGGTEGQAAADVNLGGNFAKHVHQSKEVVRQFLKAKSIDERLLYVRHPKDIVELMQNDTSQDWAAPLPFTGPNHYDSGQIRDNLFTGIFVEDKELNEWPIDIEVRGDRYLVDWESFAEYNKVPWEEMKRKHDPNRFYTLRAIISLDDYYNYEVFKLQDYQCFRISNRAETETMFVYASRGGWVEKAFREHFRNVVLTEGVVSAFTQLVQIEIQFPNTNQPEPMAEITSYIAPHWFTLDPAYNNFEHVSPSAILGDIDSNDEVPFIPEVIDWENQDRLKSRSKN
jgi:hypothetical protein